MLWRAAFGPMAENANQLSHISQKDLYQVLIKTSSKEPAALNVAGNMYDGLIKGLAGHWQNATTFKRSEKTVSKAVSRRNKKSKYFVA